jgi:hypothetical protein
VSKLITESLRPNPPRLVHELERDFPVTVDWLPNTLDIPGFPGMGKSMTAAT